MLWLNRYNIIPVDCVVVHKNGITVDNRLSNLELAQIDPVLRVPNLPQISAEEEERRARSGDIYRTFVARTPPPPHTHTHTHTPPPPRTWVTPGPPQHAGLFAGVSWRAFQDRSKLRYKIPSGCRHGVLNGKWKCRAPRHATPPRVDLRSSQRTRSPGQLQIRLIASA